MCKLRSWSNNNGDGYENITPKVKSRCFKLYRAYSILFNSSNVVNFLWSWILKECIEVQEKKKKVVVLRSRPPQNVLSRHSRAVTEKNVQKSVMHIQSYCFPNLNHYCFFAVLVDVAVVIA